MREFHCSTLQESSPPMGVYAGQKHVELGILANDEYMQEPLGNGGGRVLHSLGRALSWGGGDEREGLGNGLVLDGAAREGLKAEHLAVAIGGERREQGPEGKTASGEAAALGLGVRRRKCKAE
jgi:hypothetical protein